MKKKLVLLISLLALVLVQSCTKDEKDPVLNAGLTTLPAFTSPTDGASFILTADEAGNTLTAFEWTPTVYNLQNIGDVKYILQMDVTGNTFESPLTLQSADTTFYSITVGAMNQKLVGAGLSTGEAHDIYFRVVSFVIDVDSYESVTSQAVKLSITPYSDVIVVKPIYMLGDGTLAGWDNTAALEMTYEGGSVYSIVSTLTAGGYLKFISQLGAWAPMWGTDETGTAEGGPLVYRPDEATTDPPAIPAPATTGEYKITVDTALLTYTIGMPNPELYMLGDGTPAGWDNAAALPMNGTAGEYSLTLDLPGGGNIKFIVTLGQWAPQYGTDETGTSTEGPLILRPDEATPDPIAIPAPADAGNYTISVNTNTLTYSITAN